jgi:hypothetical protein
MLLRESIQIKVMKEIQLSNSSTPLYDINVSKEQMQDLDFYFYLKHIALFVSIVLMLAALSILIFCIVKYKKTVRVPSQSQTTSQNGNVPKKNIFKRMWDMRLKKKVDDQVYDNFVNKTESEISHVSNNSNTELCSININSQTTSC